MFTCIPSETRSPFMRRPHPPVWFWLSLALALGAASARGEDGEVIYLRNGDELNGVSRGIRDGAVRWELPHGTQADIPIEAIERIEYRLPPPLMAPLTPKLLPSDESSMLDLDESPSAMQSFEAAAAQALDGLADWTKRVEVGARLIDGNSDNDYIDVKTLFERQSPMQAGQFDAGGQFAQASGDRITNRWFANGNVDFSRGGRWIWFVTSKNEFDEFENLDYRGTFSSGPGYRFYNDKHRRLIVRVGPGVTYERFNSPTVDRTTADAFGEVEMKFPLFDRTRFEHKTTVNPSLEDHDVFRLVSTNGILVQLDDSERWALKLGLRHEYNSEPNVGREPSDYTSSIVLVYTRK